MPSRNLRKSIPKPKTEKSEAQILAEHQSRAISRMAAANGKKVDEQELIKDLTESYSRIFNGEV